MAEPVDHLAGKTGYTQALIAALTDDELGEQLAYFQAGEARHRGTPDEEGVTRYKSHAYAAYRYSNWVGMVEGEQRHRASPN